MKKLVLLVAVFFIATEVSAKDIQYSCYDAALSGAKLELTANPTSGEGSVEIPGMGAKSAIYSENGGTRWWVYTDSPKHMFRMLPTGVTVYFDFSSAKEDETVMPSALYNCSIAK